MRADRLLSILLLLQTGGRRTAFDLATRLEVSERTIYRDLDALSAAGVPVYAAPGPGGGVALTERFRTDLTGLTDAEAGGVFAAGAAGPLADIGVAGARDAALLKLLAALPASQRRAAERMRERVLLDPTRWRQPDEAVPHLPTIQEALFGDRVLRIVYQREDRVVGERLVAPYGLVAKASVWYLVGRLVGEPKADEEDDGMRVFRVSRVREATVTDEGFQRPAGFDLQVHWRERSAAFERSVPRLAVTMRVAPDLAAELPRIFGEGIRRALAAAEVDDDGWPRVELTFDGWEAALAIALGFGTGAEVVSPPELRASVLRQASDVLDFYGRRAAGGTDAPPSQD